MTETQSPDRAERIAYVIQALQLDPTRHSEAILAARTAALGLAPAVAPEPKVDVQENRRNRQQATVALGNLRNNFWHLPPKQLLAELDQIASLGFTELAGTIARLQTIARHRQAFLDLAKKLDTTPAFIGLLKEIFVHSPREIAGHKETVRQAMSRPLWRRSPRRFLAQLHSELPEVYRVEEEWFNSLLNQRMSLFIRGGVRATSSHAGSSAPSRFNSIPWWGWVLLVVGLNVLRTMRRQ